MVLQGTAVSGERLSQFSPGNVAGLGGSRPLLRPSQQLAHFPHVGSPPQGTQLTASITPEVSLERLIPLVSFLAAWKLLPNVSHWVLRTVERGYRIQFGSPPPRFSGVLPTVVGPEQALVLEQEVHTLLRKEAIEVVPPHDRESGFYSRYFIVPKKGGGLRPILDLRQLNLSVARLKFRMLTVTQVVSQISWYYIVVVPGSLTSSGKCENPDEMELDELLEVSKVPPPRHRHRRSYTEIPRPYVAAKLEYLPETFMLGDEQNYNGFYNRPVPSNQPYQCFIMAEMKEQHLPNGNEKQLPHFVDPNIA
ncbi:hypothetical protein PGIGA_G00095130 [Pangasianodon gigas]|uniref:Uncharacterized protein n=1 Tax=Pangasianodon gigas TaxID=30993 RepID=A0ACC5XD51_PANGG|nr:hypothetical protein [Pangasianodon gigas]